MQIPCPSIADLRRADESLGIGVSDVELEAYQPYLAEFVKLIDEVDRVATVPPVRYPRSPVTGRTRTRTPSTPGTGSATFEERKQDRSPAGGSPSKTRSASPASR